MTRRLSPRTALACLFLLVVAVLPARADTWNYPQPDPNRDVKDITFYVAPEDQELLAPITDGSPLNVILLIGDGMGFNHVTLARNRAVGAGGRLHMERMPVTGILRTHAANALVTDSGSAATALAAGIRTDNLRIGTAPDGAAWKSILEKAKEEGFRTGLVATSSITHATPAAFAAHVDHRSKEAEIAAQMLANRVGILFGGGRKHWLPEPQGDRKDGRNLIVEARAAGYRVIFNREQLLALEWGPTLGLFAHDGMTTYAPEPMLDEMTRVAIHLLSRSFGEWFSPAPRFFLMVEGSQIDWAGHANNTDNTIRQTLLFDMAVREALAYAQRDRSTLVVVTADHETGGLIIQGNRLEQVARWTSTDHTAGDVPVYAFGPGASLFTGALDITDIPKLIARLLEFEHFPAPLKAREPAQKAAG